VSSNECGHECAEQRFAALMRIVDELEETQIDGLCYKVYFSYECATFNSLNSRALIFANSAGNRKTACPLNLLR
jgi:hypothetical protein